MATDPKLIMLAQAIGRLNMQEKHELFKILEETYNMNIQNVLSFVPIPSNNSEYIPVGDVYPLNYFGNILPPSYQLVLLECGRSKLMVVKTIKELTNLGLKEAKELADRAPSVICEVMEYSKAEEIQKAFEHIGAEMDIRQIN